MVPLVVHALPITAEIIEETLDFEVVAEVIEVEVATGVMIVEIEIEVVILIVTTGVQEMIELRHLSGMTEVVIGIVGIAMTTFAAGDHYPHRAEDVHQTM